MCCPTLAEHKIATQHRQQTDLSPCFPVTYSAVSLRRESLPLILSRRVARRDASPSLCARSARSSRQLRLLWDTGDGDAG